MLNELSMEYIPPPKSLPGFPKAKPTRPKTPMGGGKKRKRWIDPDTGDILEWDYQHGRIERYDSKGNHRGEYDTDGNPTKPADPTRTITPTMWAKPSGVVVVFLLARYGKTNGDLIDEILLEGFTENDVRGAFGLASAEYPGDCLVVEKVHEEFLEKAIGKTLNLGEFDYFVEARQP